jgi:cyanophycinase
MTHHPCILALLATAAHAGPYGKLTQGNGWDYIRLGNPNDVTTSTQFGILFEGGGTDVDGAYQWMCEKANGGDFLVIRASGNADYNPYIYGLCPSLNSVATLIIYNRTGAEQEFVKDTILKAEAVFIAGGDQAQYVEYYTDSHVDASIDTLAARGVPIGGTSAGNAILAQFGYSGITGSVTSQQALSNPFTPLITIENGLLDLSPLLLDKITDDHFVTRNRMGRLVTFLARIIQDGNATQVSGIATNENTAFLMEADGSGTIAGSSTAYFLRTPGPPEVCQPNTPLTYDNVSVYRVHAGDTFNIMTWTGTGGTAYTLTAITGALMSSQPGGAIY